MLTKDSLTIFPLFAAYWRIITLLIIGVCSVITLKAGEMDDGEINYIQGEYYKAIQAYRRALELKINDNNRALCWYMIGQSYLQLGKSSDAKIAYNNIVNNYSSSDWLPDAYVGLGDAARREKKYSEAIEAYKKSATTAYLRRYGSLVYWKLAQCYRALKDTQKATYYENAIVSQYPQSLEAQIFLRRGGKTSQASKPANMATAKEATTKSTTTSATSRKFAVQVACTPKKVNANQYAEQLKKKGYRAYVKTTDSKKAYLVLVGNYASREEATKVCNMVKKSEKNDSFVINI